MLQYSGLVESILAKPYATSRDVQAHCQDARENGYRSIILPSALVADGYEAVDGTSLKVGCLIGFPFGSSDRDAKRYETELAVDSGAHEIELVPTLGRFFDEDYSWVLREIRDVVEAADERPVSVVIEVHLWSDGQLSRIVQTVLDSGAQFVSTTTGLMGSMTDVEDVEQLRALVGPAFGIKASGLKDLEGAEDLIKAGANRLGFLHARPARDES